VSGLKFAPMSDQAWSGLQGQRAQDGPAPADEARRPKVCFLFIAQRHQIFHAVSLAVGLARAGVAEVHVAGATSAHLAEVRRLAAALGGADLTCHRLWPDAAAALSRGSIPPKAAALALNLGLLRRFDAFVTPERTSLLLKRLGLGGRLFIHTDHGAGDRAVGYERRIALFDFVLLAGEKQSRRMKAAGLIREGGYAVVGYPKFDVVDALDGAAPALFDEPRPTVLYNPHFHRKLSSWPRFGFEVLEQFAASRAYNLVFAPHVRLFDGAPRRVRAALDRFAAAPNIHVDLDGAMAWDMTYTRMADVYLGDVSSQVYEFLRRPKPCLFLDGHVRDGGRADWRGDENYAHWRFGPVLDRPHRICEAVKAAVEAHEETYAAVQAEAFAETFDLSGPSTARAVAAVSERLATWVRSGQGYGPAFESALSAAG